MALKLKKQPINTEASWVEFDKDTKIQMVGIDHPHYQIALERARRRLRNNDTKFEEGNVGVIDGEKNESETQAMLLSNFIVKGWSGVEDADGNPLEFSADACAEIMTADPTFFLFVLQQASKISTDAKQELQETLEKSSPATPGKENGRAKQKSESSSITA